MQIKIAKVSFITPRILLVLVYTVTHMIGKFEIIIENDSQVSLFISN